MSPRARSLSALAALAALAGLVPFVSGPTRWRSGGGAGPGGSAGAEPAIPEVPEAKRPAEAGDEAAEAVPTFVVRGRVTEPASGEPVAGAYVAARNPYGWGASAHSGEDGIFLLRLDERVWTPGEPCEVHVANAAGREIWSGGARAGPVLEITTWTRVRVRGRLAAAGVPPEGVAVGLGTGAAPELRAALGAARLDPDGAFALEAWLETVPDELVLAFVSSGLPFRLERVASSRLLAGEPIEVAASLTELRLHLRTGDGLPLPRSRVRALPEGLGDPAGWGHAESDPQGEIRLLVPDGAVELLAACEGHAFSYVVLTAGPAPGSADVEIRLDRLEGTPCQGVVQDLDGRGVAGAIVTLVPDAPHAEFAAVAQVLAETDAEGRFAAAIAGNLPLLATVYHPTRGGGVPVRVEPAGEDPVVLLVR